MSVEAVPGQPALASLLLWTVDEDLFIISQACFQPAKEWPETLQLYAELARENPRQFTKVCTISSVEFFELIDVFMQKRPTPSMFEERLRYRFF